MMRTWAAAAAIVAVVGCTTGCTSVRMVERDGCWLKQTEKWPSRVNEELAFCKKVAPAPAQDPLARLVQECVAQADYRWENRAIDAWNRGDPIPPRESDEKIAAGCMTEAAAALGPEAERAALKARLSDLDRDRNALRNTAESDREFFRQSNDKMAAALGEAAKKPAPAAVATATSTGTATTESELKSQHEQCPAPLPPTTVVGFNAPATPVVIAPVAAPALTAPLVAPPRPATSSAPCAAQRKASPDKVNAGKPGTVDAAPNCGEKPVANAPASPRAG
jgi:hypothetical protein